MGAAVSASILHPHLHGSSWGPGLKPRALAFPLRWPTPVCPRDRFPEAPCFHRKLFLPLRFPSQHGLHSWAPSCGRPPSRGPPPYPPPGHTGRNQDFCRCRCPSARHPGLWPCRVWRPPHSTFIPLWPGQPWKPWVPFTPGGPRSPCQGDKAVLQGGAPGPQSPQGPQLCERRALGSRLYCQGG